jgi:hypothetical protein
MRGGSLTLTLVAIACMACTACKSTREPADPIEALGLEITERVEVRVVDAEPPPAPVAGWRAIDRQGLGRPSPRILGGLENEFLELLRANSRASFNARWIDEGAVLPREGESRRLDVRRVLTFADADEVRRCVPSLSDEEIGDALDPASGCYELTVAELQLSLLRSLDGSALRVVLDSMFAYGDILPELRLVPDHEGVIPLAILLTLRSVGEDVRSSTVVFDARVSTTDRSLGVVPQESDWIPVGHRSAPWSLQLTIFDQREVDGLMKDLDEKLEPFLRLAGKLASAGL